MTKKEQSRLLVLAECVKLWLAGEHKGKNLCLEFSTGVGKTLNAINLQDLMTNNLSRRTYVCVAEKAHIQNWKDEYIKHGYEHLLPNTDIFCYASLKKYINRNDCDLLILDEMHHAFSENRISLFNEIRRLRTIGLSATISDEDKYAFGVVFGKYDLYTITMEQAIEMEILPKPKVYLMPLKLDNKHKSEIIEFNRGRNINEIHCDYLQRNTYIYNRKTYPTLNLKIHCTQQEKYNYLDAQYESARLIKRPGWLRFGGVRKRFLSDCKTNKIKELCVKLNDKRFICFCGSIEQAEEIGGDNCIHSKKVAKKVIHDFNNYKINSLFAVGMMTEGQNLPGIEAAIVGQLDGGERPFIQKSGRGIRAEFPEIYVLYFENTKDLDYLENVINNVPEEYIIRI